MQKKTTRAIIQKMTKEEADALNGSTNHLEKLWKKRKFDVFESILDTFEDAKTAAESPQDFANVAKIAIAMGELLIKMKRVEQQAGKKDDFTAIQVINT
jgi:hypothetical protein